MNWTEHSQLVEFYTSSRSKPADLYPSEERFLPQLATSASTILDVGCGAGGFQNIWKHFNSEISYTGVDPSYSLIEAANLNHPDGSFQVANGTRELPFEDRSFDVVAALGWLHLEPQYAAALPEIWRVTGSSLFFDVRLHPGKTDIRGTQRLELTGAWDGETTIPYICAAWHSFAEKLIALAPYKIRGYGYSGPPSSSVKGLSEPVVFATFVLDRKHEGAMSTTRNRPIIDVDLPLTWPETLRMQDAEITKRKENQ